MSNLSYARNANSLLRRMGPPSVPPNWLRWNLGVLGEGRLNGRASKSLLRMNSHADPCRSFDPDLVATLIWPPACPYSAPNIAVCTWNS